MHTAFATDLPTSLFIKLLHALMEEFKYTPLNLERPAIRLLSLHPGNDDMVISCELFQAEFHQRENMLPYEALSYTWGCSELSNIIHVNGCYLGITHNLYSALVDLRYQDRQRVLWIDAVCIDQKNDKERGHQVGQMGNIYHEANGVIFRLGSGTNVTDAFMESLQRLQKESLRHACRAWSRQDGRWKDLWYSFRPLLEEYDDELANLQQEGLQEILNRPWFRRVWILQEVALAKAGTLSCGKKSVSAGLFGLAPQLLGITPDAHCQSVFDIMPSPWKKSTWWSESRSLYTLLLNFGNSEATDPRDLVYALRGISSDLSGKKDDRLFPDYEKPLEKLVYDVIQYIYGFDVTHMLKEEKEAPRLSSIRELVRIMRRLETDICRYLAETRSEILVTKNMIKAAAQYDKDGTVVNALLRCRGGDLKIDDEILLCAAANLNAAKEVFEAFWNHQNQLVITEEILLTTAKNLECGHSAMRFLLSLKTQVYIIASISKAITWNIPEILREEIIRMLLLRKDYRNDTIPEVLTAASEIQDYNLQKEIITTLLQQKDFKNDIVRDVVTAAAKIQYHDLQKEIIETLLQKKGSSDNIIRKVIIAAIDIRDSDSQAEIIKTLLQQKGSRNNIISEVMTGVNTQVSDLQTKIIGYLIKQKGNTYSTLEFMAAAAKIQESDLQQTIIEISKKQKENNTNTVDIIENLLKQKGNSNDTISKCLTIATNIQPFGPMIIRDFVRKNPVFGISRDAVIVAMKNWPGETNSFEVLCRYFPSLHPSRKQVA
ncbi:heterokaryon incompatibility domain-containing protein [Trichoderma sp. SZMC 28013]